MSRSAGCRRQVDVDVELIASLGPASAIVAGEQRDRSGVHDRELAVRFSRAVGRVPTAPVAPGIADDAHLGAQLSFIEHLALIDRGPTDDELDDSLIRWRSPQGAESGYEVVRRAMRHACNGGRLMHMSGNPFPGRDDLWLDDGVVARRHDNTAREAVEWIHRFLDQLSFNAPVRVPYFEGASVVVIDDVVWGALSYVDGETVDWSPEPSMFELDSASATSSTVTSPITTSSPPAHLWPRAGSSTSPTRMSKCL